MPTELTPSAEAQRDLAGADLHEVLNRHVLAEFLGRPEAGPALTATAEPGNDLCLILDPQRGTWAALQAGQTVAAGRMAPDAHREVAEAGMHAITCALNAAPADDRRRIGQAIEHGAELQVGLRVTPHCDTLMIGLSVDGNTVFKAMRVIEHPAEHVLTPWMH